VRPPAALLTARRLAEGFVARESQFASFDEVLGGPESEEPEVREELGDRMDNKPLDRRLSSTPSHQPSPSRGSSPITQMSGAVWIC
jgi:hypothetical protein